MASVPLQNSIRPITTLNTSLRTKQDDGARRKHLDHNMTDLDEFDGLTLTDVTPKLEKWWFQYPHLLKLKLLLLCVLGPVHLRV